VDRGKDQGGGPECEDRGIGNGIISAETRRNGLWGRGVAHEEETAKRTGRDCRCGSELSATIKTTEAAQAEESETGPWIRTPIGG